jgi:hypothetical protein
LFGLPSDTDSKDNLERESDKDDVEHAMENNVNAVVNDGTDSDNTDTLYQLVDHDSNASSD